jgi:polyisoprenoid-binding protein YceI
MRHSRNLAAAALTAFITTVLAAAAPPLAAEQTLTLDPAKTRITFLLGATGHDVEGAFALRSGALRLDPATGAASGEIVVDLTVGKTGNDSRDGTMQEKVLKTPKFPVATLRAERFTGTLAASGSSQITLEGTLSLHGTDHPVKIPAKVAIAGTHLSATAELPVPFVEWGLTDPSIMFLRVEKVVQVRLVVEGELAAPPAP